MKKWRNPKGTERRRTEEFLDVATSNDWFCKIWLHIANGRGHMEILDDLFEDFGRVRRCIELPTVEVPDISNLIAEKWGCIAPEDAAIVEGELPDDAPARALEYDEGFMAHYLWHFAGSIGLVGGFPSENVICFCEYNADKREGGMIVFFHGRIIPQLVEKYPQLKRKIKIASAAQYERLGNNW